MKSILSIIFPQIDLRGYSISFWTESGEERLWCSQMSLDEMSRIILSVQFSSLQSLSRVRLFVTPWITAGQATSQSSLRLMSIKSVMPSSRLTLCCPLLLLPPIPPSIRVLSNESTLCMTWPDYWSFSFSIIPSKEIPGLISFRMDWLDLLAVQGTTSRCLNIFDGGKHGLDGPTSIRGFRSILFHLGGSISCYDFSVPDGLLCPGKVGLSRLSET